MTDMYDCFNTDAPVCPYCGHADVDWWDGHRYEEGTDVVSCVSCGEKFVYEMETATKFETEPLEGWDALEDVSD